jgi:hypothetical protein
MELFDLIASGSTYAANIREVRVVRECRSEKMSIVGVPARDKSVRKNGVNGSYIGRMLSLCVR